MTIALDLPTLTGLPKGTLASIAATFPARLADAAARTIARLDAAGLLRDGATIPTLRMPPAFEPILAAAIALDLREDRCPAALETHYLDVMPAMRVEQLSARAAPNELFFHTPLDWSRLPRMSAAIDRLFALLRDSGVPPDPRDPDPDAFRAARPTLAAIVERTHYGAYLPLLYGYPGDLAYFASRLPASPSAADVHVVLDRYLTAPVIHELAHLAPDRPAIYPPYLDECIAGWIGVHVLPSFAYPEPGHDDGLYASPWLAQVGQMLARVAGAAPVVRAHAGLDPGGTFDWAGFTRAAARLGWADYAESRPLHFLGQTFRPDPWLKLMHLAAAGRAGDAPADLAALAAIPWRDLPAGEEHPDDLAILENALRAMCLRNVRRDQSFRVESRPPPHPVTIDLLACTVSTPPAADSVDTTPLAHVFPPAAAARLRAARPTRFTVEIRDLADLPALAGRILGAPDRVS